MFGEDTLQNIRLGVTPNWQAANPWEYQDPRERAIRQNKVGQWVAPHPQDDYTYYPFEPATRTLNQFIYNKMGMVDPRRKSPLPLPNPPTLTSDTKSIYDLAKWVSEYDPAAGGLAKEQNLKWDTLYNALGESDASPKKRNISLNRDFYNGSMTPFRAGPTLRHEALHRMMSERLIPDVAPLEWVDGEELFIRPSDRNYIDYLIREMHPWLNPSSRLSRDDVKKLVDSKYKSREVETSYAKAILDSKDSVSPELVRWAENSLRNSYPNSSSLQQEELKKLLDGFISGPPRRQKTAENIVDLLEKEGIEIER